jgi:hypothetical protein
MLVLVYVCIKFVFNLRPKQFPKKFVKTPCSLFNPPEKSDLTGAYYTVKNQNWVILTVMPQKININYHSRAAQKKLQNMIT